ncbi:FA9 factor, partial [Stercorarius parasiticus]|nr:FA9 factor [Stercorarius parasiticus]
VFMRRDEAHEVLKVHKRANYFLEEIRPGNLERECNEEKCSFEEAKEIFHSQEKTVRSFILGKIDESLNPCSTNPCKNGGVCKIRHYNYFCICPPRFGGDNCEKEKFECWYKNGGCWQYCRDGSASRVACSCAQGYSLQEDGKSCLPAGNARPAPRLFLSRVAEELEKVENAAGQNQTTRDDGLHGSSDWGNVSAVPQFAQIDISSTLEQNGARITGGTLCHRGHCPWQVLIRNSRDTGFCGGSLISSRWVVTAAHCLDLVRPHHVTIGDFDKYQREFKEQKIGVERSWAHPHYDSNDYNGDIALLYLSSDVIFNEYALPICLPSPGLAALLGEEGRVGMVSGWGATHDRGSTLRFLMKVRLPIVAMETCQRATDRLVTDNMFCAGYRTEAADACKGDSGGPFTMSYHNTWFLLGIVSWGEGCAEEGKYGVYTRVSNYLPWIKEVVESV